MKLPPPSLGALLLLHGISFAAELDPGFGVEFETSGITMINKVIKDEPDTHVPTTEEVQKMKGTPIEVKEEQEGWICSAEVPSDTQLNPLRLEYILDGISIKLGDGKAKKAAQQIQDHLVKWSPKAGMEIVIKADPTKKPLSVTSFDRFDGGKWVIDKPTNYNPQFSQFSRQITTPMSLASIYKLLKASKGDGSTKLLADISSKKEAIHLVKPSHEDGNGNLEGKSEDFLAFMSLVITYGKKAGDVASKGSAKHLTSIMPRTYFSTMYKIIQDELCGDLWPTVEALSKYDGKGEDDQGSGFGDAKFYNEFTVKEWVESMTIDGADKLSARDSERFSQVGGLKGRMEYVYNTQKKAPLFELRDLGSSNGDQLASFVEEYEALVIQIHQDLPGKDHSLRRRQGGASCEKKDKDKCPPGAALIGLTKKCIPCLGATKPSADGKSCEADPDKKGQCPEGKMLDPVEGGQTKDTKDPVCIDDPDKRQDKCPEGKVPASPDRDDPSKNSGPLQCGDDADDKDKPKCDDKQYQHVTIVEGKAKYECRNDTRKTDGKEKKPNTNDPKDPKNTDPNDPNKEKKSNRGKFCLAFVAGSGLIAGAEELDTDEGLAELEASAEDWPAEVEWKEGDLTQSNVAYDIADSPNSKQVVTVVMETRSLKGVEKRGHIKKRYAGIIRLLGRLFKTIFSTGLKSAKQLTDDLAKAVAKGKQNKAGQKDPKKTDEINKLPSAEKSSRAKQAIEKIRKDPSYIACLGLAFVEVADATLHIDNVPEGGFPANPDELNVKLEECEDAECSSGESKNLIFTTHDDHFWHNNRIHIDKCNAHLPAIGDGITGYIVQGGCCTFYGDGECKEPLFSATNREDQDLGRGTGTNNDIIQSFACTYDLMCSTNPGNPNSVDPNSFAHGACGVHITQYQRPKDYTGGIKFDVEIKDANQVVIGSAKDSPADGDHLEVKSKMDKPFILKPKGDMDVPLESGEDKFSLSDGKNDRCSCGAYDGDGDDAGKRQCDCGFTC